MQEPLSTIATITTAAVPAVETTATIANAATAAAKTVETTTQIAEAAKTAETIATAAEAGKIAQSVEALTEISGADASKLPAVESLTHLESRSVTNTTANSDMGVNAKDQTVSQTGTASPNPKNESPTQNSDQTPLSAPEQATELTPYEKEVEGFVEIEMKKWDSDSNNHEPDRDKQPNDFVKWANDRNKARFNATRNAHIDLGLKHWDQDHPQPDQSKEPDKFKQWQEDRNVRETFLKKQQEVTVTYENSKFVTSDGKVYELSEVKNLKTGDEKTEGKEDDKDKKEKPKKEQSDVEVAQNIERLRNLKLEQAALQEGIKVLNSTVTKSDQQKVDLAKMYVRKSDVDTNISGLESDLKTEAAKNPVKGVAILTALAAIGAGVVMAKAAKLS